MPRGISLDVINFDRVKKNFREMADRLKNPDTVGGVIAGKMFKDVDQHFRQEQGRDGQWARLKRPRKRGGTKVLQDTGNMRMRTRWRIFKNTVILFNNTSYAKYHQKLSGNNPNASIPKREFFWLSPTAIKSIVKTMARFIGSGEKR